MKILKFRHGGCLSWAVAALMLGTVPLPGGTAPAPGADTAGAPESGTRTQTLTLRALGAQTPIELRSTDQSVYLPLSMRLDETVVRARLKLNHTFSPGLLADLSQLKVFVNDEVLATVAAAKGKLGSPQTVELDLDPRYFTEHAKLRVQFIGHYTLDCEYPFHSSLWAQVSNQSSLEIVTRRLPLRNDLALLPAPFFDVRDGTRLRLPFVMAASPSAETVRSAGVLATWFGALASYRGAQFPVSDHLPEGHAVVLATNDQRPAGLALPAVDAPTLKVIANPQDPGAKLLLVLGRDAEQLQTAANALVLGQAALSGELVTIDKLNAPPRLAAHDAPNFVKTGSLIRLGSLVPNAAALQVVGAHLPMIRLPLRLPADTFAWQADGLPMDLRYRYTPPGEGGEARLAVQINGQLIESFALRPSGAGGSSAQRTVLPFFDIGGTHDRQDLTVPTFRLTHHNELQFGFEMAPSSRQRCHDSAAISQAAIDGDSTLDLRNLEHYTTLPNLALFANGGFPFTKYADLAETALILPDAADAADIETALGVLGQLGATTGAAGTRLQVLPASRVKEAKGLDLLVIASGAAPAPLVAWSQHLPARIDAGRRSNTPLTRFSDTASEWFSGAAPRRFPEAPWTDLQTTGPLAALMAFESPVSRGRSVVALQGTDGAALARLSEALLDPGRLGQIQGDLTLVRGNSADTLRTEAFRIGEVYQVGDLRWWRWVWFHMRGHPLPMVLLAGLVSLLLALPLYRVLRLRAGRRVRGEP